MAERIDDLQIKGYKLIQNPDLFCFGCDAVILSSFAKVKEGARVIDLGCGNGVIPILLAAKTNAQEIVGLEIQEESATLARRSVELNGLEDRIKIVNGDIKEAVSTFGGSSFDAITTNPPYMNSGCGLTNDASAMTIARHEVLVSLEDIIGQSAGLLRPGGHFYMIHRPHRLADIISLMRKYKIEPKRMRMVHPYADKEPTMVLIEGLRGGKPNLTVDAPLIIYKEVNQYTDEIYDIYGYNDKGIEE